MDLDKEGWLLPTYPGATYLIFSGDKNPTYLLNLMENDCSPGDALFNGDLLLALEQKAPG